MEWKNSCSGWMLQISRLNYSLNDGDAIAEWIDLSEKGNHVYLIIVNQPVFDVDGLIV